MKPRVFVTDSSRPSLPSDTAGVLAGGHAFRHRLPAGMPWMPLRLSGAVVARCAFPSLVPVQARVAFGAHCHQSTECLFQEPGTLNHSVFCRVTAEGVSSSLVKLDLDREGSHNSLSYTLMSLSSEMDSKTRHRQGETMGG